MALEAVWKITKAVKKAPVTFRYRKLCQNQKRFVRGSNDGLCVCMFVLHALICAKTMCDTTRMARETMYVHNYVYRQPL